MRVSTLVILNLLLFEAISCREENKKNTLFQSLPASRTGIEFVNKVEENDLYNVMNYMNIYTGAGVAAGDINNDGLTDLFFSGKTKAMAYLKEKRYQLPASLHLYLEWSAQTLMEMVIWTYC
jgi:hypothetical protein